MVTSADAEIHIAYRVLSESALSDGKAVKAEGFVFHPTNLYPSLVPADFERSTESSFFTFSVKLSTEPPFVS